MRNLPSHRHQFHNHLNNEEWGGESEEDEREIRAAFELVDIERNGKISGHSVGIAARALGFDWQRDRELRDVVERRRGGGWFDVREFVGFMAPKMQKRRVDPRSREEDLRRAFRMFDADGKGWIDIKDLQKVSAEVYGPNNQPSDISQLLNNMIQEFDLHGDGKITLNEFTNIMNS